jgi:hypothetical protein
VLCSFVSRPVLVCVAALALCACGGGGGGSVPAPLSTPSPQPAASPTPPAIAPGTSFVSAPATVALVVDTPLALPYGGDFPAAPTIELSAPAAPFDPGASFTVIASSAVPDDIPALARARAAASLRATESLPSTPLFVLSVVSNVDVALTTAPKFRFTLPQRALVAGVQYWLALFDVSNSGLGWQYGFEGPGTLAGSVVSFAGGQPIRFPAGSRMIVTLYALPAGVVPPTPPPLPSPSPSAKPTPTPVPSRTPSPSPSSAPSGAPASSPSPAPTPGAVLLGTTAMTFTAAGAQQTSSVAQANGTGAYTVGSSNPSVATATVHGALVTVTAGAASGGATIAVTGAGGQKATIAVAVDLPGSPTFSQPTMSFDGLGATMTSTVAQAGYGGPFTVTSADKSIATATISGSTITVTSVGAGTTTIAVTGGNHQSATISVTVTTFAIGVH